MAGREMIVTSALHRQNWSTTEVIVQPSKRRCRPRTCFGDTQKVSVPTTDPAPPPDLAEVNALMNNAREAVFFATFLLGESGKNNIIGTAVDLTQKPGGPLVLGAVSDPRALPKPSDGQDPGDTSTDSHGRTHKLPPPAIWWPAGQQSRIVMIRAAVVNIPVGNFRPELLSAGHEIGRAHV